MTSHKVETKVRPLTLEDLDAIFLIDRKIREVGKAVTYANLTTEHIFTIDRKVSWRTRATSYLELITGDMSGLLELGFIARVEDHVRGFVLGRVVHVGEAATEVGVFLILGVHPDYQERGIAAELANNSTQAFLWFRKQLPL